MFRAPPPSRVPRPRSDWAVSCLRKTDEEGEGHMSRQVSRAWDQRRVARSTSPSCRVLNQPNSTNPIAMEFEVAVVREVWQLGSLATSCCAEPRVPPSMAGAVGISASNRRWMLTWRTYNRQRSHRGRGMKGRTRYERRP